MRISSKSILSPGRAGVRDPPNSLSTSLSRRLRNSGSIKGGASPAMFPTTAKKRGSFENPEPSSPKVTCIGQVRVKSKKKQAKELRTLSRRHSTGEVSFRKLDHPLNGFPSNSQNIKESLNLGSKGGHNQCYNPSQDQESCSRSWVHFPVTICDALRAFGSEFSCLFPCRREEKMAAAENGGRQGSCGAVFARWLVAVQDGNGGVQRDIELVVGDEDEEDDESSVRKTRRHVFEDLEIVNDRIEGHKDEARVSICIPPKNALLLMRCRSDPVRIEALTNRSWEPSFDKNDEEIVDLEDFKESQEEFEVGQQQVMNFNQDQENVQQVEANQAHKLEDVQESDEGQDQEDGNVQGNELGQAQELENMQENEMAQAEEHVNVLENEVGQVEEHEEIEDEEESLYLDTLFEEILDQGYDTQEQDDSTMVTSLAKMFETPEEEMVNESKEGDDEVIEKESEKMLPQCLLMMMYEPKLSMEVSRETWVCSTDFKRHSSRKKPPPAPLTAAVKPDDGDESSVSGGGNVNDVMRVADGRFPGVLQQPGRSSCSLLAAPSMAAVLGQKLADAVGYEPFVLTRCKSEPMKTAAAKLLPESCVWENRKVERLSRVTFGSARLGF